MKTFLDTHMDRSSTFLLYGNLNDTIWCGDLSQRTVEQYLVKLLNSRGFEHVVFYGEAGTRGAYCLDPESARFFFSENAGVGVRRAGRGGGASQQADEAQDGQGEQGAAEPAQPPVAATAMGRNKRRRTRGTTPPSNDATPAQGTATPQGTGDASAQPGVTVTEQAGGVRYARQEMTLPFFANMVSPLMLDPASRMAVVFYNVFTSDFAGVRALRDNVLTIWEHARITSGMHNVCLILAPDTQYSTTQLVHRISEIGLAPRFLVADANGALQLNPYTCFELNLPKADEIANLLRRLSIMGTEQRHRRVTFAYRQLEDIVTELIWCSRSCDGTSGADVVISSAEYMEQIENRLSAYVESRPGFDVVELTPDIIDEAWGRKPRDRETALDKLNKPGWENAYRVVSEAVAKWEATQRRMEAAAPQATKEPADWTVGRLGTEPQKGRPRPPVPHFVLLGNPGTGKTTIARLIGDVLREHGIVKVGSTVEVTRENLTSSYVGGVPKATMACVNRAEEGVLFIDEAYSLGRKDGGANHDGTGKEVMDQLVHALTDFEHHHFGLVMAGYEKEMRATLRLNDGLMRRIGEDNIITIDDYEPELLEKILVNAIAEAGCSLEQSLTETRTFEDVEARPISCFVTRCYQTRDRQRFGNADAMIKIAQAVCARTHDGVIREEYFYGGAQKVDHTWFEPTDVGNSLECIIADIRERFVGLDMIERYFVRKAAEIEEKLAAGLSEDDVRLRPIILRGEPGTGKTAVAGLLARLFFHLNLLGTPEPVIASAPELVSSVVGGMQERILEYVHDAQDRKALLFVDEAHEFNNPHIDGRGAIGSFLNPLTDREHPFMAVFAVYPQEYDDFCKLNPGVARRFEVIDLPTYTGEQLYAILHKMMANSEPTLTTSGATDALLKRVCDYIYVSRTPDTGNAGRMETLLAEMNALRTDRCQAQGISTDAPERYQFEPADVPAYLVSSLPPEDATTEQLMAELDELVGLEQVKREVHGQIQRVKLNRLRAQKGLPPINVSMHLVFTGNPGTGKTTVARLLGRLYQSIGALPRGQVIEVDRSKLVAGYVGQTALKTQEAIQNAMGGILLVDEAYTLSKVGSENDFGPEAIDTILKAMEDNRDKFVVIVTGYPGPMRQFIGANPGLSSRFKTTINFEDYTAEESMQILEGFCRRGEYVLTEGARRTAQLRIEQEIMGNPNYGNGRFVRNLFEEALNRQALRLESDDDITLEDLVTLTEDDFAL